jgi:UDP-3-O-[3-hydroxymyristoyl] glucosamine N-acyltransferase
MRLTLQEIARVLDGSLSGDPEIRVASVRPLEQAGPGDICVVWEQTAIDAIVSSSAAAFVTAPGVQVEGCNLIRVGQPREALVTLLELLHPAPRPPAMFEAGAHVAADARCGVGVYVAAGARIESGAQLGARVQVHANAVVGADVVIGDDSIIHPNATVLRGTRIGCRVVIHSGAVIGSDGFGYVRTAEGRQRKIPHVGIVEIEDDVEIGAGTTVDRAILGRTLIRRGTKIDNLVQIAHNADIGADCCIVAQAGVAGSSRIGDAAVISAQAGISDHVTVGPRVRIGAGAGVADDLASGDWMGSPAVPAARARRIQAIIKRLPEIYDELRTLRRSLGRRAQQPDPVSGAADDDQRSRRPATGNGESSDS